LATYFALLFVVLFASTLSGVFGMAGGMVLMGALAYALPVSAAMVTHGAVQFVSNGWRAILWRTWIDWKIVGWYVTGALPAILLPLAVAYVPEKPVMLITLGLIPFAALALPKELALDASKPRHAVICGFLVAGLQLISGVAGPLLDTFFVRSALDRRCVVATKATTQAISHMMKVGYYGSLSSSATALGCDIYVAAVLAAVVGTTVAGPLLEKMSNENFRKWTRVIVLAVGGVSVLQGLWLLAP